MPKKTTSIIRKTDNDYILEVKGNQKNLFKQVQLIAQSLNHLDYSKTTEKNNGRLEIREAYLYDNIWGVDKDWIDINRIIKIIRSGTRNGKPYEEQHYYISSLFIQKAEEVAKIIRGHWGIENGLHYVKDVNMNEDKSRLKGESAAENLSVIKNIAINIYRHNGLKSIKYATQRYTNRITEQIQLIRNTHI